MGLNIHLVFSCSKIGLLKFWHGFCEIIHQNTIYKKWSKGDYYENDERIQRKVRIGG